MKIKLTPFIRNYDRPVQYKERRFAQREGFYLCIRDQENLGIGEIAPLPEFSRESVEDIQSVFRSIKPILKELKSPDTIEEIQTIMDMIRNLPPSVQFGLEMALLLLLANKRKLPLANILNADCQYNIQFNTLVTPSSVHQVKQAKERGFSCYKLKVGRQTFGEDMSFMMNVISLLDDDDKFKIDCNGKWQLSDALEFSKRVNHSKINYIEDPFSSIKDQRDFASQSNIPLALDEFYHTFDVIEYEHISFFIVKPMLRGGFLNLLRLPQKVQSKIIISSSFETEVGLLGLIHLASALSNEQYHGLDTIRYFKDYHKSLVFNGSMNILGLTDFTPYIKETWIP